ncbi:NAD-dependent epimerase/dehydratase family protein [Oceaniglobus trochenteri]|uniref:NAD-dependent epimerase/dehydratase family protein n=1 Tax=Oceaniglobus trochenteri TaxID=2763260 RepID=UPI001CFFF6A0|nr:NAD-dependent epimerase/dehydratase family protein [Oceaniglobus trochenteri]
MPSSAVVTGSSGFIGYHLCHRLLSEGWQVTGVDAMTDYYDVALKTARKSRLTALPGFRAIDAHIETPGVMQDVLAADRPDVVIHLAAQAGVRHSIDAPQDYLDSNIAGTYRLLEAARAHPPKHLLFASTSSVYGANTTMPYRETDKTDRQMSFYAATKKSCEVMSHSYAHLYGIPTTAFRFFTVYGPWGRPDMALFKFVRAILRNEPIEIYNHGRMQRDFTYVDDLVDGILRLIDAVPAPATHRGDTDSLSSVAPWRVVNIGNGRPVELMAFVEAIEAALGQSARKTMMPMQPGDVPATWASTDLIEALIGPLPRTPLPVGVAAFVAWYRDYFEV